MGYYTQHIIRIVPEQDATLENYRRVADAICKEVDEYNFCIHDGFMDDSNWNNTDGTKWYQDERIKRISKHVPELTIRLEYIGETYFFEKSAGRIITVKDGTVVSREKIDSASFYEEYGYIPDSYELTDEPSVKHQGTGTKIADLYRHDHTDDDSFDDEDIDDEEDEDEFDDDDAEL